MPFCATCPDTEMRTVSDGGLLSAAEVAAAVQAGFLPPGNPFRKAAKMLEKFQSDVDEREAQMRDAWIAGFTKADHDPWLVCQGCRAAMATRLNRPVFYLDQDPYVDDEASLEDGSDSEA